jgi:hypothetical protein
MSDILNIRVTERELDLIMDLLHEAGERVDADGQPAFELCHDLMEQSGRVADDWEPTEIAEDAFVDAGIRAREMQKETSRAAQRRQVNFQKTPDRALSDMQRVNVWDDSDPSNW